jgi:hypothetical protein
MPATDMMTISIMMRTPRRPRNRAGCRWPEGSIDLDHHDPWPEHSEMFPDPEVITVDIDGKNIRLRSICQQGIDRVRLNLDLQHLYSVGDSLLLKKPPSTLHLVRVSIEQNTAPTKTAQQCRRIAFDRCTTTDLDDSSLVDPGSGQDVEQDPILTILRVTTRLKVAGPGARDDFATHSWMKPLQ